MSKTREEILLSDSTSEVLAWMKENPDLSDDAICSHFNKVAKEAERKSDLAHGRPEGCLWSPPDFHTKR
ncbi:MAG: hypothetical protein RSE54_11795 [Ruthenibacterium sp.]